MAKKELSIELDAEVAEGVLEAAASGDTSASEWLNDAAERALAAELALTGVDELHERLEDEPTDVPAEIEAQFGDTFLASP
jgi:hypothetical protein